jgi:hypothetical protein
MIFLMEFNSIVNGKEEPVTGEMDWGSCKLSKRQYKSSAEKNKQYLNPFFFKIVTIKELREI